MGDVRVVCRVRPPNAMEMARGAAGVRCVKTQSPGLVQLYSDGLESGSAPQGFTFDSVFGEDSTQQQVFDEVARPVVADIMEGYNATIFAYGQTSSGKTFTMEGASIDDEALRGIIPRTATELFARLMEADENMEFVVKVSYIEIYMERIRDLLDPYKTKINLQVREDNDKGIYIDGVTELCVTSDDELLSTMRSGAANRAVAATGMNEGSSRSHSVFMVTLYQRNLETNSTKVGKLYLVDLAGSEMVRKTGASGKQLEEAKTINKSLSALGMVINALTTANVSFVPYRDSKLTRVLQEALGGNSRTSLIINVSPSIFNAPETMSTLRFGNRAKAIKNKAVVNAEKSAEEYKQLLAKAEKAISMQQNYILVLETRLKQQPSATQPPPVPVVAAVAVEQPAIAPEVSSTQSAEQEAATLAALQTLQERVVRLEEQLAEEQNESARRGDEIRSLTAVLNDTQAVADDLTLQQRTWERQRMDDQTSRLLQEELANMKLEMDKVMFENQEIKLHVATLQHEQERLQAVEASQVTESDASSDLVANTAAMSVGGGQEQDGAADVDMTASSTPPPTPPVTRVGSEVVAGGDDNAAKLEMELKAAQDELVQHQTQAQKDIQRFTEERRQLTSQIQELALQLQTVQSNQQAILSTSGPTGMSARERQHMRSIQQKLEQLVAVHRQLLRKYASLEAEHNEARQKLGLRDERIKSLEANTRLMASNMRLQSEKHLEELSALHVQLAELRKNMAMDLEDRVSFDGSLPAGGVATSSSTSSAPVRRQTSLYVRQGSMVGDGVIRPIRGGGRRQSTMDSPPKSASIQTPDSASAGGLGFLQRMLGLK